MDTHAAQAAEGIPSPAQPLAVDRTMRAIRAFQEESLELYAARTFPGDLHDAIGQVAQEMVAALRKLL